ncbi:MAG TPA: hypothetical protein VGV61_01405 [Thermoanaerobaculia bacterium]|jgi:hypothetical protein|nr:hypothetical protein [Thermoanaerobaculia bacterium]
MRAHRTPRALVALTLGGLSLAFAGAAAARGPRDGRVAVDQICAPFGCFPGDAPGWPIEITQPGAYVLTSNLDVRAEPTPENVTAVQVAAPGVDLDLGGFALHGPVICATGAPGSCTPSGGTGDGVRGTSAALALRVHDGSITGFGRNGVYAEGDLATIERVRLGQMGSTAVVAIGAVARLSGLLVLRSGGAGVYTGGVGGSLFDSSVAEDALGGVSTGDAAQLQTVVVETGIAGAAYTGLGSRLTHVEAWGDGKAIWVGAGSSVLHSRAEGSSTPYLFCGQQAAYSGLILTYGGQPVVGGSGLSLGQNACYAGGAC